MKLPLALVVCLAAASGAQAQSLNSQIADFKPEIFKDCTQGTDVGKMMGVPNPASLIGNIIYPGKVLTDAGLKDGLVRQPLALPIDQQEVSSPDLVTCSFTFEVANSGELAIPGLSIAAARGEVYRGSVTLVARQKLATVPEKNTNVQPWVSERYKTMFQAVVNSAPATVETLYLFDSIAIYVINVERLKKASASAGLAFIAGSTKYSRDEQFKGTRIIVTGSNIGLSRAQYAQAAPRVGDTPQTASEVRSALLPADPAAASTILQSLQSSTKSQ